MHVRHEQYVPATDTHADKILQANVNLYNISSAVHLQIIYYDNSRKYFDMAIMKYVVGISYSKKKFPIFQKRSNKMESTK